MTRRLYKLLRAVLAALVLALLVYGFAQTLPLDLALLFAGDTMLYVEAAAVVWLAAQTTRLRWAAAYARLAVQRFARGARVRARRSVRRVLLSKNPSSDEDRSAPALAYA